MDMTRVWRRFDGREGSIVNECRCADGSRLYKVLLPGYKAYWMNSDTLGREFSRKPLTEAKNRTARYVVTA